MIARCVLYYYTFEHVNPYAFLLRVGRNAREESAVGGVDRLDEERTPGQARPGNILGEENPQVLVGTGLGRFRHVHELGKKRGKSSF